VTEIEPSSPFLFPDRLHEGYVFDLDGTIYLDDDLLPGAKRLIETLREPTLYRYQDGAERQRALGGGPHRGDDR
jgi:hypothetical protein